MRTQYSRESLTQIIFNILDWTTIALLALNFIFYPIFSTSLTSFMFSLFSFCLFGVAIVSPRSLILWAFIFGISDFRFLTIAGFKERYLNGLALKLIDAVFWTMVAIAFGAVVGNFFGAAALTTSLAFGMHAFLVYVLALGSGTLGSMLWLSLMSFLIKEGCIQKDDHFAWPECTAYPAPMIVSAVEKFFQANKPANK